MTPAAPPRAALAGLALPGLGHLLTGRVLPGVGLLGLDALLVGAALAGFGRLGEVFARTPWHGPLAVATWAALAAWAWSRAWRLAHPRPLSPEEASAPQAMFRRALLRHRNGMLGLLGVGWMLAVTLLAPLLMPYDPDSASTELRKLAPSAAHWFGTDESGRDMLSRTLIGARISMAIGFVAVSLAATIGTTVGAVAGWFGGRTDRALMWVVDLLLAMPRLVLLLAIVGTFNPKGASAIFLIVVVLGLTGWPSVSRIVRSQVLSLRKQDFIQAAIAMGMSDTRIIFRHLVPNATAPVIVYSSLAIGSTILAEASLSFLGLGVQPPTASWGTMIADGKEVLRDAPWVPIFPGLAMVFTVMSFNLLGDGLRDALDPKQRGR